MSASTVRLSNLELVPRRKGKPASYRALAEFDFTPWEPAVGDGDNPVPSVELMDGIGIASRLARSIMFKTRDDLIAMHTDRGNDEVVDRLMTAFKDAGEILKELAWMLESANCRVLASMVAAHVAM